LLQQASAAGDAVEADPLLHKCQEELGKPHGDKAEQALNAQSIRH